jgi:hypothetical protein
VAWGDQTDQPKQRDRPDERYDQAHQDATAGNTEKRGEDPPAQEGANDSDHDIAEHAVAMAADNYPSRKYPRTASTTTTTPMM